MSGTEFNLAALPFLPSAAFYLTSALISFSTIFGLPSPVLPPAHTLFENETKQSRRSIFLDSFLYSFKKFILRSLGGIPLHNSRRKVTNKSFNRNVADWQISPSTKPGLLISRLKRNARWLFIIWFKWLLQCTIDTENKRSESFHFIIHIYEPVMWCGAAS